MYRIVGFGFTLQTMYLNCTVYAQVTWWFTVTLVCLHVLNVTLSNQVLWVILYMHFSRLVLVNLRIYVVYAGF